jgi:hypothetical protein
VKVGTALMAITALSLGVMGAVRGDFTMVFHPVPEDISARPVLLAISSGAFVASGALLFLRPRWVAGGAIMCGLYALLSLGWLQRVIGFPALVGTWLGFSEQIALALGALAIALSAARAGRSSIVGVRIAFGLCQVIFALGHFLSLPETIAMTPGYIPPGPKFWALATGVLHLVGAVALMSGLRAFLATRLLAAMFACCGALVWLPQLVADGSSALAWAGNVINLALIGAVLSVGDPLPRGRDPAESVTA